MKRSSIIALCCILLADSCARTQEAAVPQIIPQPRFVQAGEGSFTITRSTPVYVDIASPEILRTVEFLNERLQKAGGFTLDVISNDDPLHHRDEGAVLILDAGLMKEAYNLEINQKNILIEYGSGAGIFYAIQTLFQLLPDAIFADSKQPGVKWSVPCCSIEDEPRFPYRGMHLDCCLHFFDIPFLKRYIDLMALHKVNRFHWHLTEDQGWRIEIKKYPLLTEKGQWRKETVVG